MFDLGWSKLLILAVVAIVVVGPKELPGLLRTLGRLVAQLRRQAGEFRAHFDEAMRDTELQQIRQDIQAIKSDAEASLRGIGRTLDEDMKAAEKSLEPALNGTEQKAVAGTAAAAASAATADKIEPDAAIPASDTAAELVTTETPSASDEPGHETQPSVRPETESVTARQGA